MLPSIPSSQNAKAKSAATSFPKGPRLGGGTGREASALGLPASGSAPTHHWSAVLVCSHALGRWRTSCGIAGSAEVSGKGKRTFHNCPPCNRQNAWPKGYGNQIGGDQHRRVDDVDAVLVGRCEIHVEGGVGGVCHPGHQGHRMDLHLRQLLGQQFGGLQFALFAMISELKLPITCPALALSPNRATMSDQVCV